MEHDSLINTLIDICNQVASYYKSENEVNIIYSRVSNYLKYVDLFSSEYSNHINIYNYYYSCRCNKFNSSMLCWGFSETYHYTLDCPICIDIKEYCNMVDNHGKKRCFSIAHVIDFTMNYPKYTNSQDFINHLVWLLCSISYRLQRSHHTEEFLIRVRYIVRNICAVIDPEVPWIFIL